MLLHYSTFYQNHELSYASIVYSEVSYLTDRLAPSL